VYHLQSEREYYFVVVVVVIADRAATSLGGTLVQKINGGNHFSIMEAGIHNRLEREASINRDLIEAVAMPALVN
jgi:hypothetical protein